MKRKGKRKMKFGYLLDQKELKSIGIPVDSKIESIYLVEGSHHNRKVHCFLFPKENVDFNHIEQTPLFVTMQENQFDKISGGKRTIVFFDRTEIILHTNKSSLLGFGWKSTIQDNEETICLYLLGKKENTYFELFFPQQWLEHYLFWGDDYKPVFYRETEEFYDLSIGDMDFFFEKQIQMDGINNFEIEWTFHQFRVSYLLDHRVKYEDFYFLFQEKSVEFRLSYKCDLDLFEMNHCKIYSLAYFCDEQGNRISKYAPVCQIHPRDMGIKFEGMQEHSTEETFNVIHSFSMEYSKIPNDVSMIEFAGMLVCSDPYGIDECFFDQLDDLIVTCYNEDGIGIERCKIPTSYIHDTSCVLFRLKRTKTGWKFVN